MNELYIQDCLFASDNDAEIPTLRLDMQANACNIPFVCWGEQKRTFQLNGTGTLHFYTDDYRFNTVYEHPEKITKANPGQIVEPNFSLFNEIPIAFGLQAIYKKRWIARVLQDRGVKIFVDLNVAQKYYKLNMIGVPLGWNAFATRGYSDRLSNLEYEYEIAKAWAKNDNPLFVIYGGGKSCRSFAKANGCIYVNPVVTTVDKIKARKIIENSISFFNEDFSVKSICGVSKYDKNIEDYTKKRRISEK